MGSFPDTDIDPNTDISNMVHWPIGPIIGLIRCNVRAVDISLVTTSRKTLTLANFYAICSKILSRS